MTVSSYKHLTLGLSVLSVLLLVFCGTLFWKYGWLYLQVAMASEQTEIFEDMRTMAVGSDAEDAVGYLKYVVNYYPSGSKQDAGSRLDRIVERQRAQAVREIVTFLRTNAPEDLGHDPDVWIRKYAK